MDKYNPQQLSNFEHHVESDFSLPAGIVAGIEIVILTVLSIGVHYILYGSVNILFCLVSLFLSINLLICFWEICLYLRRDYIQERNTYWRERQERTGKLATGEILSARVSRQNLFSFTFWSDIWATYSLYDGSYADRRTFGFNVDVGNGFATLIPSLILHIGFSINVIPASVIGILGVMMFWQWTYCTSLYWGSFFVAGRQKLISKKDMYIYIWGTNAPWVIFSLIGLYASIRLVLDGSYAVFGH